MTNKISSNKAGLALGLFLGLMHAGWASLVACGWAQPLINFIFRLHFIDTPFSLLDFDLGTAVLLVIVTSLVGYVVGNLLAFIWNYLHR